MVAWSRRQTGRTLASGPQETRWNARVSPVWRWLLTLGLVGCSVSSGDSVPATTTTTLLPPLEATNTSVPPTSSTVAAAFVVPPVIDLHYVQRVLEAIYHLDGEATRHAYANKGPDAESDARLDAIFGGASLTSARDFLRSHSDDGFRRLVNPPGDPTVRAVEVIQATSTCIVVRAALDFGPQYSESVPAKPPAVIQMARADVLPYNPTGWGVVVAGEPDPRQDLKVCS